MLLRVQFKDGHISEHQRDDLNTRDTVLLATQARDICTQLGYTPSADVSINLLIKQVTVWDKN